MLRNPNAPRVQNMSEETCNRLALLRGAGGTTLLGSGCVVQVEKQLLEIPAMNTCRLLQRKPRQRGEVVPEAFVRDKADRIPAGVSDIRDRQAFLGSRTEDLVVLGAILAILGEQEPRNPLEDLQ